MFRPLLGLSVFAIACGDAAEVTSEATTTTAVSDPVVLMYLDDDCRGSPMMEVNLANHRSMKCSNCWDRCELEQNAPRSYRLTGDGIAVVAWNCVGAFGYDDAGFARGGTFDASKCHSPGGGGTVVLCTSSFEDANIAEELVPICNLSYANVGITIALSSSVVNALATSCWLILVLLFF